MSRFVCLLTVAVVCTLARPVRAEKVDMSAEELRKTATHIVTGQVVAIYQRTESDGDWKYTKYVAEVRVAECEKGDGLKKGDLVYIRYWRRGWQGKDDPKPDTTGHRDLPGDGATIRAYLARNAYDGFGETKDGGFNVIGANGFEKVKAAGSK